MVLWTPWKLTAEETVVVAPLVPPVIVSPEEKVPEGMVRAILVLVGRLVIDAVAPLVPPVIVSGTLKAPEAATVIVRVPAGYSAIPSARVIETCSIVH
tara:strand:- start:187 stop:480 length:294 start_codon:yes stop_codon:yes gene_type:complete